MTATEMLAARTRMVEQQIAARGVRDRLVLSAMRDVPRERFVPAAAQGLACEDGPLSIGWHQTISQPYVVAFMIEALSLKGGEKVLEIGTGSGYAAAVLGEIAAEVCSVERIEELADRAAATLADVGCSNVSVRHADGTLGWLERAPFDGIVVSAGGPSVPLTLKSQLKIGGRLVIPIGSSADSQELMRVTRLSESEFQEESLGGVRFVPLIGQEGWPAESSDHSE